MLRFLYRGVVRLHPSTFRDRFGDEMLSIFDGAKSNRAAIALLADAMVSLGRQWLGSPRLSNESRAMAGAQHEIDAMPSFATLDSFHPQPSAILDGLVLSVALFCLTCFAIRYSWIRVLHIHIPEVQVEPYSSAPSSVTARREERKPGEAKSKETNAAPERKDEISPHFRVEPLPVEAGSVASAFEATTGSSGVASNAQVRPLRTSAKVHPNLHAYEGIYICSSPQFTISVTADSGNLAVRIDDQPMRTLSALSATTFVIDGTDDRIEFDRGGDAVIHQLHLLQGERQYTADRQ